MKEIEKNTIVRLLKDRSRLKVINTPQTYMANGSYEVIKLIGDSDVTIGGPFWVKPVEIEDTEWEDDLSNYLEVIYDEEGVHIVPKNIDLIKLSTDRFGSKQIVMSYPNTRHKTVTFYIGDTNIIDEEELTDRPEEITLKDKITKVILGDEE